MEKKEFNRLSSDYHKYKEAIFIALENQNNEEIKNAINDFLIIIGTHYLYLIRQLTK